MITDSDDELDRILAQIADAGATRATVFALHLRPGAREWFLRYLATHYAELVEPYMELYRGGAYVSRSYSSDLARRGPRRCLRRHDGLDGRRAGTRGDGPASPARCANPSRDARRSTFVVPGC